jgi:hypothetical protein
MTPDDSNAVAGLGVQHWLGRAWATRYAALHHVLLAATIASVTVLAQQQPFFARFDVATRAMMSYAQALRDEGARREILEKGYRPAWNPAAAGDRPLVVIVRRFWEQAREAGLHPAEFAAGLIRGAAEQRPAVLAVDLVALDPFYDDSRLNDPDCDYLTASAHAGPFSSALPGPCDSPVDVRVALRSRTSLMRAIQDAARATVVVVTAPVLPLAEVVDSGDPVQQRILVRKMEWTRDVCQMRNVHVALLLDEMSNGIGFERNIPTLGNLVWKVTLLPRPRDGAQFAVFTTDVADPCTPFRGLTKRITHVQETIDLSRRLAATAARPALGSIGTISSRYYETMAHGYFVDVRRLRQGEWRGHIVPPGLRDRVVFLGDDEFVTRVLHFDATPWVDFQAAVYYSNLHGAISLKHAFGFLFDVVLGSLLGLLLMWSWRGYGRARMRMDQVEAVTVGGVFAKLPFYLRARGVLLCNLVLLGGLAWVMFVAADWLLRRDVWINPLPLVIGMSIKGLLSSRQLRDDREPRDWWAFYNRHPDVLPQILIIVISIGFVLYGGR